MKKLNNLLTPNEQKLLLFIVFFAFAGLVLKYTGLTAEEEVNSADSLNFQQDYQIKYDLQNVTKEELITIPGIGDKKAEDILQYKEQHGFLSKTDLMNIKGIGKKTYDKIEKYFVDLTTDVQTAKKVLKKLEDNSVPKKININTADKNELTKITGIGPSKADKIIALREKIGRFMKKEDLLQVKGIGEKTLKKIEEQITLGE
ncbi:MAG: ComEA family DNA-binding protein [Candidatus Cloacimonetes bacterium]|jgi:competence protein ComEA|nr:ComEA family DNA-binding protein [Candidatus Cloacimonadota bacterium]MBT4575160.1 ComEA family DNA-binding protein [Candidatus Cloacimonadota bacterium]MBT5419505.1 ComEA family DNA-binding protein [Candidatus Cloacimonadota bacterium]